MLYSKEKIVHPYYEEYKIYASDGAGKGHIDYRMADRVKAMKKHMDEHSVNKLPDQEEVQRKRDMMGDFNYNLNEVPIYTRYEKIQWEDKGIPVFMYYPRSMKQLRPLLLYIHGGGFLGGSVFVSENACRYIAEQADCTVAVIDYSLAPEVKCPKQIEQIYFCLEYFYENAYRYQVDPGKIFIAGDSAGGNMAAVVAQQAVRKRRELLAGEILIYAKLLFLDKMEGFERDLGQFHLCREEEQYRTCISKIGSHEANIEDSYIYLGTSVKPESPIASPMLGEVKNLPKTLMIQAEYDGLRLEGEHYAEILGKADVDVTYLCYGGMIHGFFDLLGLLPQSEAAAMEIAQFLLI